MKISVIVAFLCLCGNLLFAQDTNSGTYFVNANVESHVIVPNGTITTNQLIAGNSYFAGESIVEFTPTTKMFFYLTGGQIIETYPNSDFTIDLFDQEITNINSTPALAGFGNHALNLTLKRGEFVIIYPNQDEDSSFNITTPYTSYLLSGGQYYFRVDEKSSVVFVGQGTLQVVDDKGKNQPLDKNKISIAIPYTDPVTGTDQNILSSIKTLTPHEISKLEYPIQSAVNAIEPVKFIIVNKQVIGFIDK